MQTHAVSTRFQCVIVSDIALIFISVRLRSHVVTQSQWSVFSS